MRRVRKVALLCAVLCGALLCASEQDKEICGEPSSETGNMFDALKNCAQRFEQAAGEFKGYLDSNVFKDANQTQPAKPR